jgi:20S proteasome alpha/beta subunit
MTVVLSLLTRDGVVIASDSEITEADRGLSFPAQKLHDLGDRAAWGGSGSRAVLGDVQRCFTEEAAAIVEAPVITHAMQERMVPILRHHYEHFIADIPGSDVAESPAAYVLAAGYTDRPWIVEVRPDGMASHFEDVGFHAIGSGAAMAQQAGTLLSHFRVTERSMDHGVVAAVRVLDSLRITAPKVGGPIDVCRIDAEGARHLDEDEVEEVRGQVRRWCELEDATFDDLFT